jgi:ketosteroid isomerase-like protein
MGGPMADLAGELSAFMMAYEEANNTHDFERVAPMIAGDATYWFTDGSYQGLPQIAHAIRQTFAAIQDEIYEISDLDWIVLAPEQAVCRYRFSWRGVIGGEQRSGRGRGTNVIVKREGQWRITHEHLST